MIVFNVTTYLKGKQTNSVALKPTIRKSDYFQKLKCFRVMVSADDCKWWEFFRWSYFHGGRFYST